MISIKTDTTGETKNVFHSATGTIKKLFPLKPPTKLLNDFYVFDTETGIIQNDGSIKWCLRARPENFIFGVIYGYNYHKVIYDRKHFIETLKESRFKNKLVFAHNLTYDLGVLYGNIFKLDPSAIFIGSRIITATNGNCKFGDSLNIYRESVEKLGKLIGIEKPSLGNEQMISKEVGADEINRCLTDCRIVWECLYTIFEDAGDIKLTQASLSITYFRRYHQKYIIEYNGLSKKFFDSYYGGRTEAFKIGKTHSSVIDVNSMYPYGMKEVKFPNPKTLKIESFLKVDDFITNYLNQFEGLIYCTVRHKESYFGFLPYKYSGKLCFPIGLFSGCWNFNEIRFALSNKVIEITNIEKIVFSEPIKSPFIDFVDYLYTKRISSTDEIEIHRIKIFLNSLYGKFAQRPKFTQTYLSDYKKQWQEIDLAQRKKEFIKLQLFSAKRKDAFLITKSVKQNIISYSIPLFSSYITSFCRVLLLQKMLSMEKFNVVYCDTDSIFYEIDSSEIETGKKLGQWKKENKIVTEIRGLKNYDCIDLDKNKKFVKIKGVPSKAEKTGVNNYTYFDLTKPKESLRRGIEPGILTERQKEISNIYDKRIVLKDGTTKPIKL